MRGSLPDISFDMPPPCHEIGNDMLTPPARRCTVVLLALALLAAACGDGDVKHDASPDALVNEGRQGPTTELPLLAGYNHSNEVAIAANDGTVVVAAINLILADRSSFESGPSTGFRRVATYVSLDEGAVFGEPTPIAESFVDSTDPVVQVGADGRFWLAALDGGATQNASIFQSAEPSLGWTPVGSPVGTGDKVWIAAGADAIYAQGADAVFKIASVDGQVLASHQYSEVSRNAVSAYVDETGGAHVLTFLPDVLSWDGGEPPRSTLLPEHSSLANTWTRAAGAIGPHANGGHWLIRSLRTEQGAPIVVRTLPGEAGDVPLTAEDGVAFLPAAAADELGRVHVVWYDTGDERGVLRYTHSVSADLSEGFLPSLVVDDDACPGSRWYPYSSSDPVRPPGGRRLREYIGIAIDGSRAHIAWTHAPGPPSRVRVTYVDF